MNFKEDNKMCNQRKNLKLRELFEQTYEDLCDVLSCFEPQFHNEIFKNYIKTYKIQQDNPQFLGRLIVKLNLKGD